MIKTKTPLEGLYRTDAACHVSTLPITGGILVVSIFDVVMW